MSIRVGLRPMTRLLGRRVVVITWTLVFSEDWGYEDANHLIVFSEDWGYVEPPDMTIIYTEDWGA